MKLKYFNINHSLEDLKKKRKQYALRFHPDLYKSEGEKTTASKKMAEINAEYDYVVDPKNRVAKISPSSGGPIFTSGGKKSERTTKRAATEKEIRQAQNLFHALSNGNGFDAELFVKTANAVKRWTIVLDVYSKNYGEFTEHIAKYIKKEHHRIYILDFVQGRIKEETIDNTEINLTDFFNILSKIFKR